MFQATHFRTEFIQQRQAMIIRKVTMTQFMLMILLTAVGVGLLGAPFWLTPVFLITGYAAGYTHHGEAVWKRAAALLFVWGRRQTGTPQILNIAAEWTAVQMQVERQQRRESLPATVLTV